MSKTITILGAVFSVYALIISLLSNFNLGVLLTLVLGILILLWGIFYNTIKKVTEKGFLKFVKIAVLCVFLLECLLVGFIAIYGQFDNAEYNEDAMIVLGAGIRGDQVTLPLQLRLDKAVEYHYKNPEAIIVVTGGQGLQETVTEAYAMEKYLVGKGVNKNNIIKEEKATSTKENMHFSKVLLDAHFNRPYKTVIVTNNFHIYRGTCIAKTEGLTDVSHIHAGLQWYNIISCYIRESLAVVKMWMLG